MAVYRESIYNIYPNKLSPYISFEIYWPYYLFVFGQKRSVWEDSDSALMMMAKPTLGFLL